MDCISTEIIARENYEYLKKDQEPLNHGHRYSGSALNVPSKTRKFGFYDVDEHYSDRCNIVTDTEKRKELLKKTRLCFNCLKGSHQCKNCKVKIKCSKCKKEVNHHTALCNPNYSKNVTGDSAITCLIKNNTSVLLQTANVLISDKKCDKRRGVKLLLDPGSQQTFAAEKIFNTLDLKPVRSVNVGISRFLSNKEGEMSLKEYKLKITSMDGKYTNLINALGLAKICPNIQGQNLSCVIQNHEFSKELQLAITAKGRQTLMSLHVVFILAICDEEDKAK